MRSVSDESFVFLQDNERHTGTGPVMTVQVAGSRIEFVRVPHGSFPMGSPPSQADHLDDETLHRVDIDQDFWIAKFAVTRGQFRTFVNDTDYRTEAETDGQGGWGFNSTTGQIEGRSTTYTWASPGYLVSDDHPVTNVTWADANAYCDWLSDATHKPIRMPQEAEWEYACRAGSSTRFFSGDDPLSLAAVANIADNTTREMFPDYTDALSTENGYIFTAPVGSFLPNSYGLYDMHGNAWEWCSDRYDLSAPPGTLAAARRVMRGGGFGKRTPRICSSSRRVGGRPDSRDIDLGFRICFTAAERSAAECENESPESSEPMLDSATG